MKTLKNITFTNKEWIAVKKAYIYFYKTQSKCSHTACPIFDTLIWPKIFDKIHNEKDYCILCHQFKEFKSLKNKRCPCSQFGQNAFVRLEKLVKRLIKE